MLVIMDIFYLMEREMQRRGLSPRSIKSYLENVRYFLDYCRKDPKKITKKDVREYLIHLYDSKKSPSTQNLAYSSIKFMLNQILYKSWKLNMRFSKRRRSLPLVLTKKEITELIDSYKNPEHKLLVSLIYGAGLRLSEAINLKYKDLEPDQGYGWVRGGKGNKDRLFVIPEKLKNDLRIKMSSAGAEDHLFKGRNKTRLSRSSVYHIVRLGAGRAGILKKIHPHTLRHSFATHLIEDGNDLLKVQLLMGHNSLETTRGYIHVAVPRVRIKSPLDNLFEYAHHKERKCHQD
jgi:integrase/recombinase XerD